MADSVDSILECYDVLDATLRLGGMDEALMVIWDQDDEAVVEQHLRKLLREFGINDHEFQFHVQPYFSSTTGLLHRSPGCRITINHVRMGIRRVLVIKGR